MRRLVIEPDGWPCRFDECRPGFFLHEDNLCLKSEYGNGEAYNEAGETFTGGSASNNDPTALVVQPVVACWEKYEVE